MWFVYLFKYGYIRHLQKNIFDYWKVEEKLTLISKGYTKATLITVFYLFCFQYKALIKKRFMNVRQYLFAVLTSFYELNEQSCGANHCSKNYQCREQVHWVGAIATICITNSTKLELYIDSILSSTSCHCTRILILVFNSTTASNDGTSTYIGIRIFTFHFRRNRLFTYHFWLQLSNKLEWRVPCWHWCLFLLVEWIDWKSRHLAIKGFQLHIPVVETIYPTSRRI